MAQRPPRLTTPGPSSASSSTDFPSGSCTAAVEEPLVAALRQFRRQTLLLLLLQPHKSSPHHHHHQWPLNLLRAAGVAKPCQPQGPFYAAAPATPAAVVLLTVAVAARLCVDLLLWDNCCLLNDSAACPLTTYLVVAVCGYWSLWVCYLGNHKKGRGGPGASRLWSTKDLQRELSSSSSSAEDLPSALSLLRFPGDLSGVPGENTVFGLNCGRIQVPQDSVVGAVGVDSAPGPPGPRLQLSHLLGGVRALVLGERRINITVHAYEESEGRAGGIRRRSSEYSLGETDPPPTNKMRRTSLPAISVQRPTSSQSCGGGGASVDGAILSEAHGLVADMLQDPHLPPAVVSGLQALYLLLAPPSNTAPSPRGPRPAPYFHLSQDAYASGSDTEENPYTGERPSIHRRSGRRSVNPTLLRRMSTSTWTTTTSATGMPTLEPGPCRKRASSFRAVVEQREDEEVARGPTIVRITPTPQQENEEENTSYVTPCGSPTHACCLETRLDPNSSPKNRSYSTTALYPSNRKPVVRERQTVCSLHPLGDYDVNHLDRVARGLYDTPTQGVVAYSDRLTRLQKLPNQHVCDGLCDDCSTKTQTEAADGPCSLPEDTTTNLCECKCSENNRVNSDTQLMNNKPIETTRNSDANSDATNANIVYQRHGLRVATSDYESSDSPSSIETSEEAIGAGRVRIAATAEVAAAVVEEEQEEEEDTNEKEDKKEPQPKSKLTQEIELHGVIVLDQDGSTYDLDKLQNYNLLNRISEWDYPVFSLLEAAGTLILSQLCFRVFCEVGLFETFRIPTRQFLNYFHALELGYRDIPYHNSTHASDVLHAVYYLTSQPIPGFIMLPPEPGSLLDKHEDGCGSPRLIHRQSFTAEDTYGILGANLPALELMALYTAAAMHDYDHPGRTNAFLVTTNAPQAVLYNDRSVLENHHAAAAWSLFLSKPEFNFLCHLDRAEFKRFRFLVIEAILATDLKRHFEILAEFNAKANEPDAPGLDWNSETDRLLALQMCIKLADINGPCKALDIHTQWTARIAEEFYEQGDEEEKLGLPISPYMDRTNPQLSKLQESFINHLVAPLCNAYGEAGLMPGVWQDSNDEDGPTPEITLDNYDEEEDDDPPTSESDTATQNSGRARKIFCLQTQHLQENHQYWVNKIKEEQRVGEEDEEADSGSEEEVVLQPTAEANNPCGFSPQPMVLNLNNGDEPMEPIEEEKTPASISSSRSFSFEKEDSKL
ncbi:cGMP-inhibited 3',5'-cyclic phosphodiesterase 3A-like isoform X2 [Macrobrachium nipponense]|uniref:cGMP-inhibited 3',5'-cyclic phosphodiesterase 3A-like isoform X2 n=1 Tax=Macrobrachium nipponense TaxID=159736 RepID=UPI0030C85E78